MEDERMKVLKDFKTFNSVIQQKIDEKNFSEVMEMLPVNVEFIAGIDSIVEKEIYSEYEDFLHSYLQFCQKCTDRMFMENYWKILAEGQRTFEDCIDDMLCKLQMYRICSCCGRRTRYNALSKYYQLEQTKYDTIPYIPETINKKEYMCTYCGASDRDRMMIQFMKMVGLPCAGEEISILQIAPSKTIELWIKNECPNIRYESTDLFMKDVTFKADIQNMFTIVDNTYDFFICSHVLEHVKDDRKAMRELKRILKLDGIGIFLVPIALDLGQIDEEWGLSEEENWRRFGQGDHCRQYNRQGLIQRLTEEGFFVHPLGKEFFGEKAFLENALIDTSTLYILSKSENDTQRLMEQQEIKLGGGKQE